MIVSTFIIKHRVRNFNLYNIKANKSNVATYAFDNITFTMLYKLLSFVKMFWNIMFMWCVQIMKHGIAIHNGLVCFNNASY